MDQRDYRKHGRDTARQNRGQHTPSSSHLLPSISHSNSNRLIIQKNCSLQNPEKNDTSFQKYNKKLKEDKPQKNLIENNTHSQRNKIPENKRGSKREHNTNTTSTSTKGKKVAKSANGIRKDEVNTDHNGSSTEGVTKQITEENITKTFQPEIHLTLDNFDKDEEIPPDCPFVLTSPRSLEACKQLGVRPVDLLPFRIEDARRQLESNGDFSLEGLQVLRDAEDERREILEQCRRLRQQLIKHDETLEVEKTSAQECIHLSHTQVNTDCSDSLDELTREINTHVKEHCHLLDTQPSDHASLHYKNTENGESNLYKRNDLKTINPSKEDNYLIKEAVPPVTGTGKRKYHQPSITPERNSEESSSASVYSCPDLEYGFSDRPEADQYIYEEISTPQSKNKPHNIIIANEPEKYFLPNNVPRSSSEELSLSIDFSDDTFEDKSQRKNSVNCSPDLEKISVEHKTHHYKNDNHQPLDSHRKGSVTFCDQYNQIVLLNPPNCSRTGTENTTRKVGTYGRQRHSPNLFHNPYGPPLYHHTRPTTRNKGQSLALRTIKQDKNAINANKKSSVKTSLTVTNSCAQSHSVNGMNVPIKTYQKNNKKEIYQYNKTEGQNKEDKENEVKKLFASSIRMKENSLQSSAFPFPMKMDGRIDKRWRSIERKAPALRSRKNHSLNRDFVSHQEHISKKNPSISGRSYSIPRKKDRRASVTERTKEFNSTQYSDDISSIHRFIPNISDLDIPAHDKRILELLAIKYHKLAEAEEKSHARHLEWQREIHDIAYQREHGDEEWKNVVMKKRQEENKINSQKLLDSKRKLVQSQNHLRNLMLQKDERREKLHETAKIQKAFNFASWKVTEESRRGAVEEALEQLLARDTQYRKELKGHIENRVEAAKERRAYHRKQYIQHLKVSNATNEEKIKCRLYQMKEKEIKELQIVKISLKEKMERMSMLSGQMAKLSEKNSKRIRISRAIKYVKVLQLKEELDRKFDEWRKRLLDVQKQSIRTAEERVVQALEQRRQNLISEMKLRKEKHENTFQKILEIKNNKFAENKRSIMMKYEKAEKFKEEQEKALERSRALARKTAELRDAIRNQFSIYSFIKRPKVEIEKSI